MSDVVSALRAVVHFTMELSAVAAPTYEDSDSVSRAGASRARPQLPLRPTRAFPPERFLPVHAEGFEPTLFGF